MDKMVKYGWIAGLVCLLAGGLHLYNYFNVAGTLGLLHLIVGLLSFAAGVFNLVCYAIYSN